jgi:hypothetical protein
MKLKYNLVDFLKATDLRKDGVKVQVKSSLCLVNYSIMPVQSNTTQRMCNIQFNVLISQHILNRFSVVIR